MEERNQWIYRLLFCGLVFLVACTSNRQSPPRVTIGPSSQDLPSYVPTGSAGPLEKPIPQVIARAQNLFDQGKLLFEEGCLEAARAHFHLSLGCLKNAGYDFYFNPKLEQTYYALLNEIQTLELLILIDPSGMQLVEIPFPEQEPAFHDELAGLNLFTLEVDPALRQWVSQDLLQTHFDIPVVLNDSVLRFLNYYQGRGRKFMKEGLKRSGRHLALFREIFRREGIPLDLIYMAHVESLFKPRAYSRAHAKGIWQFIRGTGKRYGLRQDWWIDERSDIVKSTEAAARYLKDLYSRFEDWYLVLAAYNSGHNRIERIIRRYGQMDYWTMVKRRLLPRETRNYVPSILASLIIFRHPEHYGFQVKPDKKVPFEMVAVGYQVDLQVVAELIGVPLRVISELNPELRRRVTPYTEGSYFLKVPAERAEFAEEKLSTLPPEKRLKFKHHRVRRGETLSGIGQKYSTSIQAIAQVNRIRNIHRLKSGQHLIIPMMGWRRWTGELILDEKQKSAPKHTVRRGESLYKISAVYGISLSDLLRWNDLKAHQIIYPGQEIRLKVGGAVSDRNSDPAGRGAEE